LIFLFVIEFKKKKRKNSVHTLRLTTDNRFLNVQIVLL